MSRRAAFQLCEHEAIEIPRALRRRPVAVLEASIRVQLILESAGIEKLGQLHGRTYGQFRRYRNVGIHGAMRLMEAIHRYLAAMGVPADSTAHAYQLLWGPTSVSVPPGIHTYKLAGLPLPARLEKALHELGFRTLGELDKVDLFRYRTIGFKTIRQFAALIERAQAGEFAPPPAGCDLATRLLDIARFLDAGIARLAPRHRDILLARMSHPDEQQRTQDDIGRQLGVTRERVRQQIRAGIDVLSRGGPRMTAACQHIAAACHTCSRPLTGRLLAEWTGPRIAELAHPPQFYARLLDAIIRLSPPPTTGKLPRENLQPMDNQHAAVTDNMTTG